MNVCMPKVLRLSGIEGGHMWEKGIDKNYRQSNFLEKFKGLNVEFNQEVLRAAEGQGVELRKAFGKAISNMLKVGKETREILLYATGSFSIGRASYTEDVQLFGMEEPVGCYCTAYLVELGGDFWQIKFANSVGEYGQSIVNYTKARLNRWEVQFDEDTGEVIGWIKPTDGQMMDVDQLRGI